MKTIIQKITGEDWTAGSINAQGIISPVAHATSKDKLMHKLISMVIKTKTSED